MRTAINEINQRHRQHERNRPDRNRSDLVPRRGPQKHPNGQRIPPALRPRAVVPGAPRVVLDLERGTDGGRHVHGGSEAGAVFGRVDRVAHPDVLVERLGGRVGPAGGLVAGDAVAGEPGERAGRQRGLQVVVVGRPDVQAQRGRFLGRVAQPDDAVDAARGRIEVARHELVDVETGPAVR